MKKFKTLLITSLSAILLCFCLLLAGCGVAGKTYTLDYVEFGGKQYKAGDKIEYMGYEIMTVDAEDFPDFTFNKDGTLEGEDFEDFTCGRRHSRTHKSRSCHCRLCSQKR